METDLAGSRRGFQDTAWTQVLKAGKSGSEDGRAALDILIERYWGPIYFHIRRQGRSVDEAKDLTQGFFAVLLERGSIGQADRERGKFRTFLLACLRNYMADEYDRSQAKKRVPTFDVGPVEQAFDPGRSFDKDWGMRILERAFERIAERRPRETQILRAQFADGASIKEIAQTLGITPANAKVLAHRGRKLLRSVILEEIQETLDEDEDPEAEIHHLFQAFSV